MTSSPSSTGTPAAVPRAEDRPSLVEHRSPQVDNRGSIGDALGAVSRDLSDLIRQEIELAKAEARQSAVRAGRGAGLLSGAALAGAFALLFLSIGAWAGLDAVMDDAWAAVVVAVVWAVIGGGLALVGKRQVTAVPGLEQTKESVRDIPRALKGEEEQQR